VRKPAKSAPGGQVLGPTRYEIGGKVRLVLLVKKCRFPQSPHSKLFTKFLPSLTKAPGTKTRQNCPWWVGFEPHQVRKLGKSAPDAPCQKMQISTIASFNALYKILAESDVSTRCENPAKVRLVGMGLPIYCGCFHSEDPGELKTRAN